MQNVITLPPRTPITKTVKYSTKPSWITVNPTMNRVLTELEKSGWELRIEPWKVLCKHTTISEGKWINFFDAKKLSTSARTEAGGL